MKRAIFLLAVFLFLSFGLAGEAREEEIELLPLEPPVYFDTPMVVILDNISGVHVDVHAGFNIFVSYREGIRPGIFDFTARGMRVSGKDDEPVFLRHDDGTTAFVYGVEYFDVTSVMKSGFEIVYIIEEVRKRDFDILSIMILP